MSLTFIFTTIFESFADDLHGHNAVHAIKIELHRIFYGFSIDHIMVTSVNFYAQLFVQKVY